ncbi:MULTISPECIES: alpha-amylase family glycosyl hydrolase [unclassified Parafrankia]|uniref:alpha-amylase family glycosyl hydrolase n=1 Tax=unclassified Parafrankia TaxID=2994368 RepID=UPI000DD3218D|nr:MULTISPECIES: alpha-amylase family glycosyl hydrolase [unclassified Parafrankia]TCJ36494.1 alpha-amylase [Parafrankia sp. BMG5.11]CAI7979277.1 1,4-alpha-glucan branching enzyme [Frankia sp. Hr75.2]
MTTEHGADRHVGPSPATGAVRVDVVYHTGVGRRIANGARLVGSWDEHGLQAGSWSSTPMEEFTAEDGCAAYRATVTVDASVSRTFDWGVWLTRPDGSQVWGIPAEVPDPGATEQVRRFEVGPGCGPVVRAEFRLAAHRHNGARRVLPVGSRDLGSPVSTVSTGGGSGGPSGHSGSGAAVSSDARERIRFRVWAPHALAVEVAFAGPGGYIADDGHGEDELITRLPMRQVGGGWWEAAAPGFADWVGRRYLYRVTRDDGSVAWRSDMYSAQQCGTGDVDPCGAHHDGPAEDLDGSVSCSVVVDTRDDERFWADEFDPARPVPRRVEDLVIYELHVGALGFGHTGAGTFADALAFVDHLIDLGVNAVELLPMFEFAGTRSWGYGSSHFLAVKQSAGGRVALRRFVRACHQRGVAVLMDVVYNHYTPNAQRSAWQYDSTAPSRNIYYWYEGAEDDHPHPDGGYLDNVSSGWAPRYSDENVRALFVASAVALLDEFHIDGLRVDQTTSIHAYNSLHADGRPVAAANIAGRKFLRELCQTLRLVDPDVILIAEDHSGWAEVTRPAESGGLGFDAHWYVDFYHHLVGDKGEGPEYAKLLHTAGRDPAGPLAMSLFAKAFTAAADHTVVYTESHDEAGNSEHSARNILVAVDHAPLHGDTAWFAFARLRCAAALTLLSPGTPMFLMGDEVGARRAYTHDGFAEAKEDLAGLRAGEGAELFACYRALVTLRLGSPALRSRTVELVGADDTARVLAFRRWDRGEEILVVVSLNNDPLPRFGLSHPSLAGRRWKPVLDTDAPRFGGRTGGSRRSLSPRGDSVRVDLPAAGAVVFRRRRRGAGLTDGPSDVPARPRRLRLPGVRRRGGR